MIPVVLVIVPVEQAKITATVAHRRMPGIRELPVGPIVFMQRHPNGFLPLDRFRQIVFCLRQVPEDEQLNRQVFLGDEVRRRPLILRKQPGGHAAEGWQFFKVFRLQWRIGTTWARAW